MKISIVGQITDTKYDGCFSPFDLKEQLEGVDVNEPLEVEITSEGGSVFAGIQIANILSRHNGQVTTHAVGLCASIATIILMAGNRVCVDSNCFCLIHLPWSFCEGNAKDMEKEIDTLKKCEAAMMGYYKKHSKVGDDVLSKYIEDETWFLGTEFADVFDCEVIECDQQLNIAAKFDLKKFNKIDKRISNMNKEEIEEKKVEEPTEEVEKTETVEPTTSVEETPEKPTEEVVEEEKKEDDSVNEEEEKKEDEEEKKEDEEVMNKEEVLSKFAEYEKQIEELTKENEELKKKLTEMETPDEEKVTKEECEKRVSGMQASMQKQINDTLHQIKAKDEEIRTVRAELSSLTSKLEEATKELTAKSSALVEKENALATLNAGVNALCEDLPTMKDGLARCSTPAEKVAFLKSGKFVR